MREGAGCRSELTTVNDEFQERGEEKKSLRSIFLGDSCSCAVGLFYEVSLRRIWEAKLCVFSGSIHTLSFDRLRMSGCCFRWNIEEAQFLYFQLGFA